MKLYDKQLNINIKNKKGEKFVIQTKNAKHKKNKRFRAYLIYEYTNNIGISLETFAEKADISMGQLNGILNATTKNPPIKVLIGICNVLGVTLDYFCYNKNVNSYDKQIQDKWGLSNETIELLIQYKPKKTILTTDTKPKDIVKKDYNAILNLLLEKKIQVGTGKKPFIEMFNTKVLNLLICSIIHDTRFMENFKENFDKLSFEINQNKTQPIGTDYVDFTFQEIIKSDKIDTMLTNSKNELHSIIDKLLENTLQETFDNIKSNITLF